MYPEANHTPHQTDNIDLRLCISLLFMAFGYALLSVCLFRVLAFAMNSTSFFMLYVCTGMPLGALFAKLRYKNPLTGVLRGAQTLVILALCYPVLGWIIAHGPCPLLETAQYQIQFGALWKQLGYMTLATSPLFILWGAAEYSGYEAALAAPKVQKYFYLLFVWGLACALAVGAYTIPRLGWLPTVCIALAAGLASWMVLNLHKFQNKKIVIIAACFAAACFAADLFEPVYMKSILPGGLHRIKEILNNGDMLSDAPLPATGRESRLIHQSWGKYCHIELVESNVRGLQYVLGFFDGSFIWASLPVGKISGRLDDMAFETVQPGSDVCVLGAGGGRQVQQALAYGAKSITAVDIIPEVFPLFQGDLAWANGGVYVDPRVQCIAGDGRHYLENTDKKFDLIILPHTESFAATRRAAIEPGRFVHTVEAFESMKKRLKPHGALAIVKSVDRENKFFFTCANGLAEAGLNVKGLSTFGEGNPYKIHEFILLATLRDYESDYFPAAIQTAADHPEPPVYYEHFPKTPALHDSSPWTMGLSGLFFEPNTLKKSLICIFLLAVSGTAALMLFSVRSPSVDLPPYKMVVILLAGIAVGANAVCLENALIFWLIPWLFNPLSAFFVGAAVFLALWGFSSFGLKHWKWIALIGLAGSVGLLVFAPQWQSVAIVPALIAAILGSGLLFPLMGIHYRKLLIVVFLADALGGLIGGLLGVWGPMLAGLEYYFKLLPAMPFVTILLAGAAVWGQTGRE
ncbi:hypothetical protein Dalk_0927 [Desulfatibacillum aliphaticivorans]|uniref:Uncharacterized protein n=1 Tax=Desulfatibacillum aliphaticivorans TaxID=218208 RepID=B8FI65_DESAL|nr:hypothetical protein [Desulfatibacillum aliphaticivorans]ACL02632.1 hypothetical protein Dalk_0927 [Desulfatibacillum aliphaticivorans]